MVLTCSRSGWNGSPPPWTRTWTPSPGAARRSRRCAGSTARARRSSPGYLAERALRRGFAAAEVQISETETPLHKLETVYRRVGEALRTASFPPSALRPVLDSWLFTLETDATAADPELAGRGPEVLNEAVDTLLERRLAAVSVRTPAFAQALRAYRAAVVAGDAAGADALAAWLGGQPHVAAAAKRSAGIRGELDHFGAMGFLQGLLEVLRDAGHPGLLLVLDEVETLQRVRGDVRDKALNALRQLLDEIDAGRYPGLFLVITGTPAFFDGPSGVPRLPPLAQRLATDFSTDPRFDNPRAVQVRLPGFDRDALLPAGRQGARPVRGRGFGTGPGREDRRRCLRRGTGGRGDRVAGREGRGRAAGVPQEAGRRRAGPGRPVRRLRPAPGLRADAGGGRAVRGGAQRRCAACWPAPTTSTSTCREPPGLTGCTRSSCTTSSTHWAGPSLRALQEEAAGPVLDGTDALLLAPTAGGKTEAAVFPLLTAMETRRWSGLSVIYVCPLKALLNNLLPRLSAYAGWLGRRAAIWHGDVGAAARQRLLRDPPDVLLTTPESLEAMLISLKVSHEQLFSGLRAVVVDEVHAFAGDDRGWHLLAVLERLTRVTGRPIQRIGLSATVGNPSELLGLAAGIGARSASWRRGCSWTAGLAAGVGR